jgi:beta-glucosidase/6-phospho-beta-glucosidase/beta-galactosidase
MGERIAASYFMGGFECSTHRLRSGRRLDLAASTRHEEFAAEDYARLTRVGIRTARDGICWHRIETAPGRYDFGSARRMVAAALQSGVQVIWDVLHFGWPDHVDPFHEDFPQRLAAFTHGFAEVLREEGDEAPLLAPANEISFLSFAGGEAGFFNPFAHGRGDALKHQLVRGALAAGRAARDVNAATRLVLGAVRPGARMRRRSTPAGTPSPDTPIPSWGDRRTSSTSSA